YTNAQGEFTIYALPGDHNVSVEIPALWYLSSTNASFDFTLDALTPQIGELDFGVAPSVIQDSLGLHYFSPESVCSTPLAQWISVSNWGTTQPSGIVTLELDPSMQFISAGILPDSIAGTTIYWSFEELGYFSSMVFPVEISHPGVDMLGLEMYSSSGVCINDESLCLQADLLSVIECSYDPNMIVANPEGWTSQGYVLSDTDMLYTIYFQNLGNAPAQDVRIENPLPAPLSAEDLTYISSSHPVSAMYVDENDILHVRFEGIMLPDSASDVYGSQAFVSYLIPMDANLAVNTQIENTASIYFDQNEAVVTNTTLHTIYSCDGLGEFTVTSGDCFGDNIEAIAGDGLIETYSWSVNDASAGNSGTLIYEPENPGQFEITLTVSNPLCTESTSQVVELLQPEIPVISINDNILYCSGTGIFTWYLNDVVIAQGSDNSIPLQGDGVYIVDLTTEYGCTSISEPFIYSGIDATSTDHFSVYPNPAESLLYVSTSERWRNIEIRDVEGRIVREFVGDIKTPGTTTIDLSRLDAGCYLVVLQNENRTQQQLVVVR
ncbi:MAG: hypothetical protein RL220_1240, partial [Bacteroidota bacterium]